MLRKDIILCKTRNLLNEFIAPITSKADKPRQKFLRQAVGAILLSGSLIVTEFAHWIYDDCSDIFHRLKRLLNHLISPRGDLTAAVQAYRQTVAKYIQPDTPIPIDLTDLAKPRARKMKYLNLVHDGSEHKRVNGYGTTGPNAGSGTNRDVDECLNKCRETGISHRRRGLGEGPDSTTPESSHFSAIIAKSLKSTTQSPLRSAIEHLAGNSLRTALRYADTVMLRSG